VVPAVIMILEEIGVCSEKGEKWENTKMPRVLILAPTRELAN